MTGYETLECDVLVVGAGGSGLRAALEASAQGARTALACKSLLGKAATVMSREGIAAALGNVHLKDDWRVHFRDTMRGGKLRNDWRMALVHAQEAPARVLELESWGALFDRTAEGLLLQHGAAGHRHPRLVHAGERTGLELLRALQHRALHQGIDVHMECSIEQLLTRGGRICGAFGFRRASGTFVLFKCKAVVLATGGGGRVSEAAAAADCTGDGVRLALEAGAELADMDFVSAGGVRVDAESAATAVRGLFAAGAAAAGLHGAHRIAGNALAAALVFGRRAGLHAAQYARAAAVTPVGAEQPEHAARALLAPFAGSGTENPYVLVRELQSCMQEQAASLAKLGELRLRLQGVAVAGIRTFNPAWHLALELRSMLLFAEAMIVAAIERRKAGADESVVIRKSGDVLAVWREPLPEMPRELKRLIVWRKSWLNRKPASASGAGTPAAVSSRNIA